MNNNNQPKNIISPYTGDTVRPVIRETRIGDELRVEAHYTCPSTGKFISKVTVDSKKINDRPNSTR